MTVELVHPPYNLKLSSRDASTRLIETQEAFILLPRLSLHLAPLLSLTFALPSSSCLYLFIPLAGSPSLSVFVSLSQLVLKTFLPIHPSHFFGWQFTPNELNLVHTQGMIRCDTVLRC